MPIISATERMQRQEDFEFKPSPNKVSEPLSQKQTTKTK
jgi:hypothetical protein